INQIRNRRNDIAHDINQTSSWAEVDFALSVIEKELQHLGFVNDHPKYEFYMERSAIEFSKEPGILGTQSFSFGLKYKEQPVVEISWDKKLYRIDPNKAGLD
ncbi:MAG: hypothetical protein NUW09_11090, partial [Deltaproteobacteria bacterium]|nr:hypothetical protein [Deltaproteobacteria bacterium]